MLAMVPQSVSDMLKEEFPGTKFLLGPGLHRVAPGVEEVMYAFTAVCLALDQYKAYADRAEVPPHTLA